MNRRLKTTSVIFLGLTAVSLATAAVLVVGLIAEMFSWVLLANAVLNAWVAASSLHEFRKSRWVLRVASRIDGLIAEIQTADAAGNRSRAMCLVEQAEADLEVLKAL